MSLPKHQQPDFLDLLEKTLNYVFWPEPMIGVDGNIRTDVGLICESNRENGDSCWPSMAFTMVGRLRLRNVRDLIARAVEEGVPGGFCECGVWRGGVCMYARACLPMDRTVYVCDSFSGFPADEPESQYICKCLAVSHETVVRNFEKFGLNENVVFVPGYFKDSLSGVTGPLAVLRIDADTKRSTMECLNALWPKLSVGGYLICDDYKLCSGVRDAFVEYFGVGPEPTHIDQSGIWFKKQ